MKRAAVISLLMCLSALAAADGEAPAPSAAPPAAAAAPTSPPTPEIGIVVSQREKDIKAETQAVQEDELNFMPVDCI